MLQELGANTTEFRVTLAGANPRLTKQCLVSAVTAAEGSIHCALRLRFKLRLIPAGLSRKEDEVSYG